MIIDTYAVSLPPDLASGTYELITGFYDLATLAPLGETAVLQEWRKE